MILPSTTLASLLLLILTLVCWGSWVNSQRLVFKWRFELFYYDFALGLTVCLLLAVFTLGSMNPQELTVSDNLQIAAYRKIALAFAAGAVFNLANMLLVASVSISGMSVAFPLTFGTALVVNSITDFFGTPRPENSALLIAGSVLVAASVAINITAYRTHMSALLESLKKGPTVDPRTRLPVRGPLAVRGIVLSLLGGIAMGFVFPLIDASRQGDSGVGPYGLAGLMAGGVFLSALFYIPFFLNFPVFGEPLQVRDYFKGARKQHFWGFFAGIIWAVGMLAALVEGASAPSVRVQPALSYSLLQGAPLVAALWGLFAWGEFKGSSQGVKLLILGALVLLLTGIGVSSMAATYVGK